MASRLATWRTCLAFTVLASSPATVFSEEPLTPVRDITTEQVDERQLKAAIASRTLTWLTGNSASNDYISIGRVANYFGFVGLRVASGQSLSRSAVAMDALAVLDEDQRRELTALVDDHADALDETHAARIKINRALEGLLIEESVAFEDFLELGRIYGSSEAELGLVIARRFGTVAQTLTTEQAGALAAIRALYISGQGHMVDLPKPNIRLSQDDKTTLVNLSARFLSWTTGSSEYNDFEVVGKPSQHFGFVSLRVDSNHGVTRGGVANDVLDVLTPDQQATLDAAATQNAEKFQDFLAARAALMREYERALSGEALNANKIAELGAKVGEIEAEMTWAQAQAMLGVRNSLADVQANQLVGLKTRYTASEAASPATSSIERGRQLFAQCALCHNAGSQFAIAPNLSGIVGREIASDPSYSNYSPALTAYGERSGVWTQARLDAFLSSPQSVVEGTFMAFSGLENRSDRDSLIEYLAALD
ncbi:MAG: hypothetical protein AAF216_09420 [Pseudomonadota bacterium]